MNDRSARQAWLELLGDEELSFLKRFVLASGSLKKTAAAYKVSYPTVRLRLDRLIAKITIADDHTLVSDFERILRSHYADGTIDMATMNSLIQAHRQELEDKHEKPAGRH